MGRRPGRSERGSVLILAALATTAVMGFAAISIDAGRLYAVRQRLVDVCDAAALAAAQELPDDPATAEQVAREFLERNGVDPALATITVSHGGSRLGVTIARPTATTFAGALDVDSVQVGAASMVEVGSTGAISGAAPLGAEMTSFEIGESYVLKVGSGEGSYHGNFHALSLGGHGACHYRSTIISGYSGVVRVGDEIETEPGNMQGPTLQGLRTRYDQDPLATFESVSSDSPRILRVPIVSSFTDCYGRDMVRVLGFGAFFMDERPSGGDVRGRFMGLLVEAEIAPGGSDYGLRAFRFIPPES
ncbi:MAG: pilus assembly protein TadG-related protein [Ignavibacteriales bacterium]